MGRYRLQQSTKLAVWHLTQYGWQSELQCSALLRRTNSYRKGRAMNELAVLKRGGSMRSSQGPASPSRFVCRLWHPCCRSRSGNRGGTATAAWRHALRHVNVRPLLRGLYGRSDRGRPLQGHRRGRHCSRRSLRLRRDRVEPPLPLSACGDVAERHAGGERLHEGTPGARRM